MEKPFFEFGFWIENFHPYTTHIQEQTYFRDDISTIASSCVILQSVYHEKRYFIFAFLVLIENEISEGFWEVLGFLLFFTRFRGFGVFMFIAFESFIFIGFTDCVDDKY